MRTLLLVFVFCLTGLAQVPDYGRIGQPGAILDYGNAARTRPNASGSGAPPAACTAGDTYVKTSAETGQMLYICRTTNTWEQQGGSSGGGGTTYTFGNYLNLSGTNVDWTPADLSVVQLSEEFASGNTASGTIGALGWMLNGTSGSSSGSVKVLSGAWPNLGLLQLVTGTSGAGNTYLLTTNSGSTTGLNLGQLMGATNKQWELYWVFRLDAVTAIAARIGMSSFQATNGLGQNSGPYWYGLRFDAGTAADATLKFCNGAGATETCTDTGISPDTAFHTLKLRSDGTTNNKIWISLDAGTEVSVCASGCTLASATGLTQNYQPTAQVGATSTTAASLSLDAMVFWAKVGSTKGKRN